MRFIVDKMPEDKKACPFSEWTPYPPIVEKTGDWKCKNDKHICDMVETECRWMKEVSHIEE